VSAAAFEVVLNARERVQEKELTQQFEERMAIERRRIQELRVDELRVEQTTRHIQEDSDTQVSTV